MIQDNDHYYRYFGSCFVTIFVRVHVVQESSNPTSPNVFISLNKIISLNGFVDPSALGSCYVEYFNLKCC